MGGGYWRQPNGSCRSGLRHRLRAVMLHPGSDPVAAPCRWRQSSGGHLAAVTLTTDWPHEFGFPADIMNGRIRISSSVYDLVPARLSARSNYVELDDAAVAAGPYTASRPIYAPLIVAMAPARPLEFQRQNLRICPRGRSRRQATSNCRRPSGTDTVWDGPHST